MTASMACPF